MLRLAILATAALAFSPAAAADEPSAPFTLCVADGAGDVASYGSEVAPLPVVRAVWRALDRSAQDELRSALEESVARREARLNPFALDLDDDVGEPDAKLDRLTLRSPQLFGTARALIASRYCAADGFCVRVTTSACVSGERAPRGREIGRAELLAWPYAHATRVRAPATTNASVALVLEPAGAPLEGNERAVYRLFRRRAALARLEAKTPADANDKPPFDPTPPEGELLAIPTLAAVGRAVGHEDRATR